MSGDDFRKLMEAMTDPLVACDGDERVLYVNPAAERLLGWKLPELAGQPLTRLLPMRLHTYGAGPSSATCWGVAAPWAAAPSGCPCCAGTGRSWGWR